MNENIKKYWFVGLVALFMLVFSFYYLGQELSNNAETKIANKTIDNDSVIYELNGESYLAKDFYEDFKKIGSNISILVELQKLVTKDIKLSDELNNQALNSVTYLKQTYSQSQLLSELKKFGYDSIEDLKDLVLLQFKTNQLNKEYLKANLENIVTPYVAAGNGKIISHILVKVADVTSETKEDGTTTHTLNPTADEKAKLEKVLELIKTTDFAKVAAENSDDTGSASNGGSLGYVNDASMANFVTEFATAAKSLKEGEVSGVVETQFGYHIIKVDAATAEKLVENDTFVSAYFSDANNNPLLPILLKAKELNIEVKDEEFNAYANNIIGE